MPGARGVGGVGRMWVGGARVGAGAAAKALPPAPAHPPASTLTPHPPPTPPTHPVPQDPEEEESGWKYIHGDVFRFPSNRSLFCAFVGTGTQLLVLSFCIFALSLLGTFYVSWVAGWVWGSGGGGGGESRANVSIV